MHDHVEQFIHKGLRVTIVHDENADSPREDDNTAVMVCWHRRHRLGDPIHTYEVATYGRKGPAPRREWFSTPEVFEEWWQENHAHKKTSHRLPLSIYDHSGVTIYIGAPRDRWDSSQVGWIYSTRETRRACGTPDKAAVEVMEQEVETYDEFLTGQVYGYLVERKEGDCASCGREGEWEHVDSCYGIYGLDYARTEGKAAAEAAAPPDFDAPLEAASGPQEAAPPPTA